MTATTTSQLKAEARSLVGAYLALATASEVEHFWALLDSLLELARLQEGSALVVLQEAADRLGKAHQ